MRGGRHNRRLGRDLRVTRRNGGGSSHNCTRFRRFDSRGFNPRSLRGHRFLDVGGADKASARADYKPNEPTQNEQTG